MNKLIKICLYFLVLSFFACGGNEQEGTCEIKPEISKVEIPNFEFISLEDEMMKLTTLEKFQDFAKKYPQFTQYYIKRNQNIPDSTVVSIIQKRSKSPYTDTLYQDIKKHFAETTWLKQQFEEAFKHIKHYYPNFQAPKVYTTFTGMGAFGGDLLVAQDIIVISLEFFIGEQSKYKLPEQIPQYIWNRKTKDYIVPNTLLFISSAFNKMTEEDNSLVSEMVFYGKALYFVHKMMPCTPKNKIIGYTDKEFSNITTKDNQRYIWSHFVDKQLFYSTTTAHKISYVEDKPYVQEINKECPGRIGQWLGWRIIEEYAKQKPEMSFKEIMNNPNAKDIFTSSRYKGD